MNSQTATRWIVCLMLSFATALSFLDRQVLSVLAPALSAEFHMSNTAYSHVVFAFVLSYTAMFTLGGWLMDRLGTYRGLALSVAVWSVASAAHALATGPLGIGISRFFLGLGEGSCFPAATKGAAEWFPPQKRVLAIGIANGGSAFGAVVAPPLTAWIAGMFGWRGAFVTTGVLGGLWVLIWLAVHHWAKPLPVADASSSQQRGTFRQLLRLPDVWRIMGARFFFDPVFYFYLFWIPQYLSSERHFSIEEIGSYFWVPFLVLGISTILSGKLSDALVRRGWPARKARTTLLTVAALATPVSWLAVVASSASSAIALMSGLMLAHGLWITNFLGFLGDLFPTSNLATVTGLSGTAGGIGGMISNLAIGAVVDHYSFTPIFAVSALLYPVALIILVALPARRYSSLPQAAK